MRSFSKQNCAVATLHYCPSSSPHPQWEHQFQSWSSRTSPTVCCSLSPTRLHKPSFTYHCSFVPLPDVSRAAHRRVCSCHKHRSTLNSVEWSCRRHQLVAPSPTSPPPPPHPPSPLHPSSSGFITCDHGQRPLSPAWHAPVPIHGPTAVQWCTEPAAHAASTSGR